MPTRNRREGSGSLGRRARRQVSAEITVGGSFWTLVSAFIDELALMTACHPQTTV